MGFLAGEATQGELQGELSVAFTVYQLDSQQGLADCDIQQQPSE